MTVKETTRHQAKEFHRELTARIEKEKIIILLTGNSPERIFKTAESLRESTGCPLGFDFKIPKLKDRLKFLKKRGEKNIGVFSVSTAKEARVAVNSGASFLFPTHFDRGILRKCRSENVFHAPGALTPGEVYGAYDMRADAVSIFPCSLVGGAEWIARLRDMFPDVKLIPTDKMSHEDAILYLKAGSFAVAPIIDVDSSGDPEDFILGFINKAN
ncbi:MAG: bifunctional 4-hydroxy-2-oxoglutarate aldolase/2-dehydro-3-deoxy-phosphogluconate aldolase [Deltaproteobacteria bacterium]